MRSIPTYLTVTVLVLAGYSQSSIAQETARVLSATPIMQRVGIPQQVCSDKQVEVQGQKSGAGAVLGAIAGGALGNSIGHGGGRDATTALGIVGGAMVGNSIEGSGPETVQTVRQCATQTVYQERVVAFNVLYEYAGKQYSVQSPQDPGPYLAVQIVPILPGQAGPVVVEQRRKPRY